MDPSKRTARKHLYKVTRIGQSCVLFESSTVCSSSSEFKALKHQDVLKVSQGFNRLNLFTYQYGSKWGYPWTHKKDQSLHLCIEPLGSIIFSHTRIEMNRQLKTLTSSNAFSTDATR